MSGIRILIWSFCGFVLNMEGPDTLFTNECVEGYLSFHRVRPYDFDGDEDVDLRDFAKFQVGFDGIDFRTESQHVE